MPGLLYRATTRVRTASLQASSIVLVIEDNDEIRENLGEILTDDGYTCWLAATADDAFRRLQTAVRAPDVILLDWRLPGMRAERFVSLVKDQAAWARARIIVQTAVLESEIPKSLPIDGIVQKPFDIGRLLALLREASAPGIDNRGR